MASAVGRPAVIDEGTVLKLEVALRDGFSVSRACELSGISRSTYYKYYQEDEEFSDRMALSQQWLVERAKEVIVQAINEGDIRACKWWLERRAKDEFGTR